MAHPGSRPQLWLTRFDTSMGRAMWLRPISTRYLTGQGRQESNPQPTVLETVALPIELRPYDRVSAVPGLSRFAMKLMCSTSRAELLKFQSSRIVLSILLGGVISLTAFRALHCHYRTIALLLGHCTTSWPCDSSYVTRGVKWENRRLARSPGRNYSVMLVTEPAPTVRPPSRIANRRPCSIATGVISSTPIWMLSPGITISVPSGRWIIPVTSVVRM